MLIESVLSPPRPSLTVNVNTYVPGGFGGKFAHMLMWTEYEELEGE
jgi:hypothetical protein